MKLNIKDTESKDLFTALGVEGKSRAYLEYLGALIYLNLEERGWSKLNEMRDIAEASNTLEEFILIQIGFQASQMALSVMMLNESPESKMELIKYIKEQTLKNMEAL